MWTNLSNVNVANFYLLFICIISFAVLMVLLLRSGHDYSVHDTEAHSTSYGNVIKEGHGGVTAFLWVLFAVIFIWTIVYFILHINEFSLIFASAQ